MYRRVLLYLSMVAVAGCQIGDSTAPKAKVLPSSPSLAIVTGSSQTAANATSGASSLTILKPAGVVDGDLLVAQVSFEKGSEIDFTRPGTVPPGWILAQRNDFGSDIGQAIFYKKVPTAASEPGSYTWSFRKNDNSVLQVRATGGITRYAGADLVHHQGPILTSSGASGDGTALTAPGVTATENSVLIAFYSIKKRTTLSVPAPMVSVYHRQHANQSGPTARSSNELRTADGPTGARTSTASAGDKWVAQLVVLRVPECEEPDPNCESEAVNLATGGNVDNGKGGVTIKPASGATTHTITVAICPDLNNRVTDLPQFGSCIRVTADPPLPPSGLLQAAVVYACDVSHAGVANEDLLTLHKLDGSELRALPHADDDCAPPAIGSAGASLKGFLADLANLRWKSARSQLAGMLTTKPLYATMLLDEGAGGETGDFSDFQFLLPSTMEIVEETNNQSGVPGQPLSDNPTVLVRDLLGNPVAGARVMFATADGSVSPTPVVTGADGKASTAWTIENLGANSMTASGRGIAGDDPNNGPRAGNFNCWRDGPDCQDPWQPLDEDFGDGPGNNGPELLVGTGTRTFNATGYDPEPVSAGGFDFGTSGFSSMQLAQGAAAPSGWETAAFIPGANGFTVGTGAPFGSGHAGCGYETPQTAWALGGASPNGNDILVRKVFTLSMAATLNIRVSVDNDLVDIYLNGTRLNGSTLTHEGCAVPGDNAQDFEFSAAANAGSNVLAIRARDRGGVAYLNITAIPTPILAFTGSEPLIEGSLRYFLTVNNRADYPVALFAASPDLPPCGLNTSASRTWAEIYSGIDNSRLFGFCALGNPSNLDGIWVAASSTSPPPVYIRLIDRKYLGSGTVDRLFYQSNSVVISPPPSP